MGINARNDKRTRRNRTEAAVAATLREAGRYGASMGAVEREAADIAVSLRGVERYSDDGIDAAREAKREAKNALRRMLASGLAIRCGMGGGKNSKYTLASVKRERIAEREAIEARDRSALADCLATLARTAPDGREAADRIADELKARGIG